MTAPLFRPSNQWKMPQADEGSKNIKNCLHWRIGDISSVNPLLHSGHNIVKMGQNFDSKIRRDNQKIPMSAASMSR